MIPRNNRLTTPWFPNFRGSTGIWNAYSSLGSAAWPTGNRAIYQPVVFPASATLTGMFWLNVSGSTGNYDIGLFNPDYTKIAASGAVAVTNAVKTFTFTNPIRVKAGRQYWAGLSLSGTPSPYRTSILASLPQINALGIMQEDSAHPLPATMTPVAVTSTFGCPFIGFNIAGLPS